MSDILEECRTRYAWHRSGSYSEAIEYQSKPSAMECESVCAEDSGKHSWNAGWWKCPGCDDEVAGEEMRCVQDSEGNTVGEERICAPNWICVNCFKAAKRAASKEDKVCYPDGEWIHPQLWARRWRLWEQEVVQEARQLVRLASRSERRDTSSSNSPDFVQQLNTQE